MLDIEGRTVPHELHEIVDPSSTALLVIDMQNAYCRRARGACSEDYAAAIRAIASLADTCRRNRVPVVHVRMLTGTDGVTDSPYWLRMRWRASGAATPSNQPLLDRSWEAAFVPELQPRESEPVVTKYRSSAFFGTPLDTILRSLHVTTVLATGCTTEGCIESTVRDAGFRDYFPVVVTDCVVSRDRRLHEASLLTMGAYRADLASSQQIAATWRVGGHEQEAASSREDARLSRSRHAGGTT